MSDAGLQAPARPWRLLAKLPESQSGEAVVQRAKEAYKKEVCCLAKKETNENKVW